jgi:excisionase family DNA binding protein
MTEQTIPQRLLAIPEVAELCHVSEMTVRRWISTGMLPTVSLGQLVVRILPTDLEKFIEEWLIQMEAHLTPF